MSVLARGHHRHVAHDGSLRHPAASRWKRLRFVDDRLRGRQTLVTLVAIEVGFVRPFLNVDTQITVKESRGLLGMHGGAKRVERTTCPASW